MKSKHNAISRVFLIFSFICAVSIGTAAAQPSGHLVVLRSPNFGWNLAFNLEIDGRPVGSIPQGRHYHAWLPAGHHVLTVYKVPAVGYTAPTSIPVNIRPGWTNVFTATWDSNLIFLRPSGAWVTPGELWQNNPPG